MVGLGVLTISLFIVLMFAAYKYEQLEADNELYDSLLEDCNDREVEMESRYDVLKYEFDNYKRQHETRLLALNADMDAAINVLIDKDCQIVELNSIIDMLTEAEVSRNFPEEVNE